MIGRPAVIARVPGVARSLPRMRSSLLGLPTRSRAPRSLVIRAPTETGYGNAGTMETTERFPQRLGNLAHHARFPHSHSRSFLSHKKNTKRKTYDMRHARQLDRRPPVRAR